MQPDHEAGGPWAPWAAPPGQRRLDLPRGGIARGAECGYTLCSCTGHKSDRTYTPSHPVGILPLLEVRDHRQVRSVSVVGGGDAPGDAATHSYMRACMQAHAASGHGRGMREGVGARSGAQPLLLHGPPSEI